MNSLRYSNQLLVDGFTEQNQAELNKSKIAVIGAGGLGCPLMQNLAAMGIGKMLLIDNDTIGESNLNRQILFNPIDIGKKKVDIIKKRLEIFNPNCSITTAFERLNKKNIDDLLIDCDVIVDCTDNMVTRYTLDAYCAWKNKPFVFGGVRMLQGQVGVFNGHSGKSFAEVFPPSHDIFKMENCETLGTFGFICAAIAALQANEVLKLICKAHLVEYGKILSIDFERHQFLKM